METIKKNETAAAEKIHKYNLDIEEMHCPECARINGHRLSPDFKTGHASTGNYWTCIICGNQLGKNKGFFGRLIKKFFV